MPSENIERVIEETHRLLDRIPCGNFEVEDRVLRSLAQAVEQEARLEERIILRQALLSDLVAAEIRRDERRKTLLASCRDICMYCGGRALGYTLRPDGPNSAGNFIHASFKYQPIMCVASALWSRLALLDTPSQPGEDK